MVITFSEEEIQISSTYAHFGELRNLVTVAAASPGWTSRPWRPASLAVIRYSPEGRAELR